MQLDLVDGGDHARVRDDPVEVLGQVVGDADRARQAGVADLDELGPRVRVLVLGGRRPVREVEVDELEAELVQALADRVVRLLAGLTVVPQLGRDEELVARDAGAAVPAAASGNRPTEA